METKFRKLYKIAQKEVKENILPFWTDHDVDSENGGFYGAVKADGTPIKDADRCIVLNARLIWTFASAYRIFKEEKYYILAKRAYDYFMRFFWDEQYGGAYYSVSCKGEPVDTKKFVYGQAFTIYAMSEYYRATGEKNALDTAVKLMELLEKHAYDPINKGYIEALSREWVYDKKNIKSNVNEYDASTKTMNTHLHLIEAYTCLLRSYVTPAYTEKVLEHLHVMLSKILNPQTGHYFMFFTDEWKTINMDESYGHDIEGSWLMMETCEVLREKNKAYQSETEKTEKLCLKMADACLNESVMEDGSMIYHKAENGHLNMMRSWWVQAEAVVGFLNAWQMSGDEKYISASMKCWEYIDQNLIDHVNGEWFIGTDKEGIAGRRDADKVSGWKCPYHNARMCFEIIERYERAYKKK